MDGAIVDAYLDRIGTTRPARADTDALHELQLRHLRTVPFENLSIHLGEDMPLVEESLVDKVVRRRRGGFCYELNGAFGALLATLGYRVTMLSARTAAAGGFSAPLVHLALRVDVDEQPWLVDVGFGRFSHFPLRLDVRTEQSNPGGRFLVVDAEDGDIDVFRNGQPEYRLDLRPRALADFAPTCWFHRTSPESHFVGSTICTRLTETGRLTLAGRTLVHTTDAGAREERILASDGEVLATYRDDFGIELDRVPAVP